MTLLVKSLIGILGAGTLVSATSYGVYDRVKPTGKSYLYRNWGYEFNVPQFTNYDDIMNSCHMNLRPRSNQSTLNSEKIYSCAIMRMEKSSDNKNLRFNSEISIWKGGQGWDLRASIENTNEKVYIRYAVEFFEYSTSTWGAKSGADKLYILDNSKDSSVTVQIKAPNETSDWFNSSLDKSSTSSPTYTEIKEYKGAWISDTSGSDNWIFEKLNAYESSKKVWFDNSVSSSLSFIEKDKTLENWYKWSTYKNSSSSSTTTSSQSITDLITAIKDVKGKWMDLNEVCAKAYNRNLDDEELNHLKIFCSSH